MIETGVSYFGNRMLKHFLHDLEDMIAQGCTYVVHTFSENDLLYYQGTMETLFHATRDAGLGVWADPWSVMGLFGGEAFSVFVSQRPETIQYLNNGQSVPASCPNHPLTCANMQLWIDAAIEAGADTLFWDEPHFYIVSWDETYEGDQEAWACRCQICQNLYKEKFGEEMPNDLTQEVHTFRKDTLTQFLDDMSTYAKSKGVHNAICLLPASEETREGLDWDVIAGLPSIDIFGTDPYWYIHNREVREYVGEHTTRVVEICRQNEKRSHIWVQAFKVPAKREEEISVALELAVDLGAEILAAWGYGGCEVISSIASERPHVVWDVIGQTYRKLHQREK